MRITGQIDRLNALAASADLYQGCRAVIEAMESDTPVPGWAIDLILDSLGVES